MAKDLHKEVFEIVNIKLMINFTSKQWIMEETKLGDRILNVKRKLIPVNIII